MFKVPNEPRYKIDGTNTSINEKQKTQKYSYYKVQYDKLYSGICLSGNHNDIQHKVGYNFLLLGNSQHRVLELQRRFSKI